MIQERVVRRREEEGRPEELEACSLDQLVQEKEELQVDTDTDKNTKFLSFKIVSNISY